MSVPASSTCGEGVTERVAGRALRGTRREDCAAHGVLQDGFVQVVASLLACLALDVVSRGGEDPLPGPLAGGGRDLLGERAGELDPAGAAHEVALVLGPYALEVNGELGLDRDGQHRRAVLVALAAPDSDLVAAEVDVLHTQAAAFEQAQTAAVEQGRHEARFAFHASEHGAHLVGREHDRKA